MKPVLSTAKIIFYKMQNQPVYKVWVDWAVDMLMEGYDTEHLVILAGISHFDNQIDLKNITDKAFKELGLDFLNKKKVITDYVSYLILDGFEKKLDQLSVLGNLMNLYFAVDCPEFLVDFRNLYYILDDFQDDFTYVGKELEQEKIETEIDKMLKNWIEKNPIMF